MQYHWIVGIWLSVCCCYATTTLLVKPQNASASEGHRVQLNCSTDSVGRPINWRNISVAEGDSEVDIFFNGAFVNGYDDRFQMDVDKAKGVYNLVIPSVQLRDAGTYRCRDKDGAGLYDDAILNVRENYDLQIAPEHTEVQVGESVQLNCTTYYKTEPVNWQHIPFGKTIPVDVYTGGNIVNGYAARYEAQMTNTTGTSNLNITAVELRDGGLYRCIQKDGLGHHKDAELRVIDFAGCRLLPVHFCGPSSVNLTLECNVIFSGKSPPVIQWLNASGNVVNQGVVTTNQSDRVTTTLVIETDNLNLTSDYTCQAAMSRASCKPNNSDHCQIEAYDSGTQSNVIDSSDPNPNLRWLLLLLLLLLIPLTIFWCCCKKGNNTGTPDNNGPTEMDNLNPRPGGAGGSGEELECVKDADQNNR